MKYFDSRIKVSVKKQFLGTSLLPNLQPDRFAVSAQINITFCQKQEVNFHNEKISPTVDFLIIKLRF